MNRRAARGGVGAGFGSRQVPPGTWLGKFFRGSKMLTVTHIANQAPRPLLLDYRIPEHRPLIYRLLALTPPTPATH